MCVEAQALSNEVSSSNLTFKVGGGGCEAVWGRFASGCPGGLAGIFRFFEKVEEEEERVEGVGLNG